MNESSRAVGYVLDSYPGTPYNERAMRRLLLILALVGCDSGGRPDLLGLDDQVAVVGQQFVLELEGVDPDGDALTYKVEADLVLEGNATLSKTPAGYGLFRWTPVAADVGMHAFDFIVSDGDHDTTVTINIDVRASSGTVPVFREPLGAGRVVNLGTTPCIDVDILIEDLDTTEVAIADEDPKIEGSILTQLNGTSSQWRWCPTPAQVAETDRYTLILSADDFENPKTYKNYVIVLDGGGTGGPGIVINEVDYDNVGTDTSEYLELYNPSTTSTSLAGLQIVLVNGATNATYQMIDLAPLGSIAAGTYLVIAGANVTVPPGATKLDPLWTQDQIQNGAPDGIALVDSVTKTIVDAISYEGSITAAMIPDFTAPVSLVEGTPLDVSVADSSTVTKTLCRNPNGSDTNDAAADWALCNTRTIGTPNAP